MDTTKRKSTTKTSIRISKADLQELRRDESQWAIHVNAALDAGDAAKMFAVLGVIGRHRGMSQLAKETGLSRENLYRSLSGTQPPTFDTALRVFKALGFRLTVSKN